MGSVSAAALSEPRVNIVISTDEVCHISISCIWKAIDIFRAFDPPSSSLRTIATGSQTIVPNTPCLLPPTPLLAKRVISLQFETQDFVIHNYPLAVNELCC